ncbi:MAG: transglutaminase domain-containing protein [Pirellulaceae bacterium]
MAVLISFILLTHATVDGQQAASDGDVLDARLKTAGEHRPDLEQALQSVPTEHRTMMEFLVQYLPDRDLGIIDSERLLETVSLASKVRGQTDWQRSIPDDVFLNNVLPYANMDESRDPWRREFYERFWPLVKDCRSTTEAAQILNSKIFGELNVRYSTQRKRANQSPRESIDQGLASCSGLSIILVDACRAVGVPARIAGIPKWANKNGNHTWVEIWDGDWHFTGAAEYDPNGLDRTWFNADAALADESKVLNSIYAISYRPTGLHFPMVWAPRDKSLHAENVTARYTGNAQKPDDGTTRLLVRVWHPEKKERVAAELNIQAVADPNIQQSDRSRDESFDTNDIASFELPRDVDHILRVQWNGQTWQYPFHSSKDAQQMVELTLESAWPAIDEPAMPDDTSKEFTAFADSFFSGEADTNQSLESEPRFAEALKKYPRQARELVWNRFRESSRVATLRDDFEKNQVTFQEHLSPYVIRDVGERPAGGWPLVIAMHGGGNAPQELNDSQWRVMQKYYKDHPEVTGYRYLALRAPNNTWNGFYDDYVYPLIENLIAQQTLFNDVDRNKVFLIGYSHGGYGRVCHWSQDPLSFRGCTRQCCRAHGWSNLSSNADVNAFHIHGRRTRHRLWSPRTL